MGNWRGSAIYIYHQKTPLAVVCIQYSPWPPSALPLPSGPPSGKLCEISWVESLQRVKKLKGTQTPGFTDQHFFVWSLGALFSLSLCTICCFLLTVGRTHELRVYTPKFASFVVRMVPHFNSRQRKQKLPEVPCVNIIETVSEVRQRSLFSLFATTTTIQNLSRVLGLGT